MACEHDEQQVARKASSVLPTIAIALFLRSKNMLVSLPALHLVSLVKILVAEQSVPVKLQHVATEQVLLIEPVHAGAPVRLAYPDGHGYVPLTTGVKIRRASVRMARTMAPTITGEV